MNITPLGILKAYLFHGGKEGVLDYFIDAANNWIAALEGSTIEKIRAGLTVAKKILDWMSWGESHVPTNWLLYYQDVQGSFQTVVNACEDLKVTKDEIVLMATSFKNAYCHWRAE